MQLIPTVFLAISFLFILFYVLPSDPAHIIAGGNNRNPDPGRRPAGRRALRAQRPDLEAVRRTTGAGCCTGTSATRSATTAASTTILGERAPRAFGWPIWATLIEITVGISVGLISAVKRYSLIDKITTVATTAAAAIPAFVLGYLLQYAFAVTPEQARLADWMQLEDVAARSRLVVPVHHPDRRSSGAT